MAKIDMTLSRLKNIGTLIVENPAKSVAFFVLFFCIFYAFKLDHGGLGGGDDIHYMRGAYYLANHGTYSTSPDPSDITLHARRAPGYPMFLAACMKIIPALNNNDFAWLFPTQRKRVEEPKILVYFKYIQAILLLATALMTAYLILDITGRKLPAYFTLWAIAFHPFLGRYVNRFYAEMLGAFLITAFSTALYIGIKKNKLPYFIVSGLFLGFLTLTYAQWKYVGSVGIASVFLFALLERKHLAKRILCITCMILAWVCVFYPWQMRNQEHFGKPFISSGGGTVLEVRSQYNLVSQSAYWASFLYWSRAPILKKTLETFVDKDQYIELMRDEPTGVYQGTQTKKHAMIKKYGVIETNSILQREALARMMEHPVKHLLMSIPVAFRLMMNATGSVLYIGVYYLFFFALYKSLRTKNWIICVLLASPIALFCMNTLLSHGLTRYNEQATPLLVLGAIIGWHMKRQKTGDIRPQIKD
ncbi:MAG: hypothetical protein OCC46_05720 [Pseudodesulfovibrio sp.]